MTAGMSRPVPCSVLRPPLVDSDGLLDSPPQGHMVFLVQYFGLFQAALIKHMTIIVQNEMFTYSSSRVSAGNVFCVSVYLCVLCASARLPNVYFVTVVTFQLVSNPRLLFHGYSVLWFG